MRQPRVRSLVFALGLIALGAPLYSVVTAQQAPAPPPEMIHKPDSPMLQGFKWRPIGPVGQGVRIDDIAVDEKNPSTFYVGFAVSGIAKTVNNGTTFTQVFDTYGSASIADIALAPSNPDIVYVATGEANNRQTTSYGDGMYKSIDAGKTFTKIGLDNSQSLGRVLVHPRDPNTVWVAVGGHLYGGNPDRGVFMTTDGGKTWTKTLYVDEYTSATEIVIDPSNPLNLWAAMYQRMRTAWGFNGGGPGSGIYNSLDGGKTWKKVTAPGLPRGTLGRVALDFCKSQPNVIYAQIEAALDKAPPAVPGPPAPAAVTPPAGAPGQPAGGGQGRGGRGGGNAQVPNPQYSGVFKSIDKGKTWTFQSNENQRPMYFSQIRVDPNNCETVYLGGVGPTKSVDSGKTWNGLNNMGHVDNHAIWIDPLNSKHVMYGNDGGLDVSYDAGATWESLRNQTGGLAYHASVDMRHPYRVCTGLQDNGSWCGPSSVRNGDGIRMWHWISVGGGDGFQSQIDRDNPNIFYTESQNAGINRYNLDTGEVTNIKPKSLGGGNVRGVVTPAPPQGTILQHNWNSPIRLSPHNTATIYLGGRHLFISRNRGDTWTMTKELGKSIDISQRSIMGVKYNTLGCGYSPPEGAPTPPAAAAPGGGGGGGGRGRSAGPGEPCILSKNDGYVANEYGTMTEMAESPVLPGILWAGTDDGNIQVSRDGGNTWEEVGKNIPGVDHESYVSGLEASWFDAGTAYAALDRHRDNDMKPYVFKTTDYGKTWTSVTGDLPGHHVVNSIRQDPVNKNLLYAPTELGFYISLNDGKNWHKFMPNLPTGRTDDVLVHPREKDLVLATHSRSVWIMDDISALQNMTEEQLAKDAALFPVRDAVIWKADRRLATEIPGDKYWQGENAPRGAAIAYHLKSAAADAKITITDTATGQEFRVQDGGKAAGLNRWQWDLCATPAAGGNQGGGRGGGGGGGGGFGGGGCRLATPGVYKVSLTIGGKEVGTQNVRVLEDIWLNEK
jgi:photosystem II stability/assembly factor-like uncharacterized protein